MNSRQAALSALSKSLLLLGLASRCLCLGASSGYSLDFDASKFTEKSVVVDGKTIAFRAYEGLVYVANPVDVKYQSMNVYVPAEYFEGKSLGGYTADTAPIFLPNTVGGYMPGLASGPSLGKDPGMPPPGAFPPGPPPGMAPGDGPGIPPVATGMPGGMPPDAKASKEPNAMAVALSKGLVVASPGARGRTLKDAAGHYSGKAPACIVDLKAAVRYLRHNDGRMPGNAEKIISNGTSAGGALSALLGATGNAAAYEPYLKALGAAAERDDVFATSCYCPITNLDHADAAYEWLFNGINSFNNRGTTGEMTPEQIKVSGLLKPLFPAYLNSLGLKKPDGTLLTLDAKGEGSFKDYVASFIMASARSAQKRGEDLSSLPWLTLKDGRVSSIDFHLFAVHAMRQKTAPAFDALDLKSGENNLFGTATIDNQHFTSFGRENSTDHSCADTELVSLMNPLDFIGSKGATSSAHWRIRHGTIDRDTSLAIPVILATRLQNSGASVDFSMPWKQGHAGDYDLPELFAWINQVCQ